jgi:hypothetical protein
MERAPAGDAKYQMRGATSHRPALRADELRPLESDLVVNATKGVSPIGGHGVR